MVNIIVLSIFVLFVVGFSMLLLWQWGADKNRKLLKIAEDARIEAEVVADYKPGHWYSIGWDDRYAGKRKKFPDIGDSNWCDLCDFPHVKEYHSGYSAASLKIEFPWDKWGKK